MLYMEDSLGHVGADQEEKQKMRQHFREVGFEPTQRWEQPRGKAVLYTLDQRIYTETQKGT